MARLVGMAISAGDPVEVTTAYDERLVMRALTGPQPGVDFPVVWVCTEEEYARATSVGDEPDSLPWPLSALRELHLQKQ